MRKGWEVRHLGDVLKLEYGKPLPEEDRDDDGAYPAFGANGVKCRSKKFFFSKPSIIVGRKGSAGEITLTEEKFWPLDVTYFVTFDERRYDLIFLYHCLKSLQLTRFARGVKPGLNRNDVYSIKVAFPSLPEQKRIVAILDEAFEGIAAAVTNAEQNLANARELFENYLNSVFTFEDEEAETRQLATLCDHNRIITYGVIKLGEEVTDGVPCLRTSNVRWLDIETDGMKHIAASLSKDYKRTILQGGEVLVNVRGTLGGVAVAKPEMVGWNVSREVAVVPTDTKKVNSFYLAYWIARKASQAWLTDVQKGVAYTGINIADLRELPVAVPDMDKQIEVVGKLDSLSEESRCLEAIYQQKLVILAELKQAVLQKAFAGELTAQPQQVLREAVA